MSRMRSKKANTGTKHHRHRKTQTHSGQLFGFGSRLCTQTNETIPCGSDQEASITCVSYDAAVHQEARLAVRRQHAGAINQEPCKVGQSASQSVGP